MLAPAPLLRAGPPFRGTEGVMIILVYSRTAFREAGGQKTDKYDRGPALCPDFSEATPDFKRIPTEEKCP